MASTVGGDTETENNAGDTPLLVAIKNGDQNLVNVLLEASCNVTHTNNLGTHVVLIEPNVTLSVR
eukprot:COSAG01_NODE_200_length_22187_cov_59.140529_18_plen_65_part_00